MLVGVLEGMHRGILLGVLGYLDLRVQALVHGFLFIRQLFDDRLHEVH